MASYPLSPLLQLLQVFSIAVQYFGWENNTGSSELSGPEFSKNTESYPHLVDPTVWQYKETPHFVNSQSTFDYTGRRVDRLTQQVAAKESKLSAVERKLDKLMKQLNRTELFVDAARQQVHNLTQSIEAQQNLMQITPVGRMRLLLDSAGSGNLTMLNNLLQTGMDPSSQNKDGYTALHVAAESGQVEVAHLLLAAGANVEAATKWRWTPLHKAALFGHKSFCKLLLDDGAAVNARTTYNSTPLHLAAEFGHLPVVQLLVQRGADLTVKDKSGLTPERVASNAGKKHVADWISRQ